MFCLCNDQQFITMLKSPGWAYLQAWIFLHTGLGDPTYRLGRAYIETWAHPSQWSNIQAWMSLHTGMGESTSMLVWAYAQALVNLGTCLCEPMTGSGAYIQAWVSLRTGFSEPTHRLGRIGRTYTQARKSLHTD